MEWYGPLTVLPAIALLILSTSNFIIALNNEVSKLGKKHKKNAQIIDLKLAQLKRLGIANVCFYTGVLLFLVAGILKALIDFDTLFYTIMLIGVISTTIAILFLFIHSIKSVTIRQKHLKL